MRLFVCSEDRCRDSISWTDDCIIILIIINLVSIRSDTHRDTDFSKKLCLADVDEGLRLEGARRASINHNFFQPAFYHKSSEIFPRETMRPSLHLHTLIHRASELRALSRQKQNFERSAGNFISRPSTITALQSVLSIPRYDGIIIAFHIFIHAIHRASGPLRNFD